MKFALRSWLTATCMLMLPCATLHAKDSPAQARQLQMAQAALTAGQYAQAWKPYRSLADKGHPLAQFVVGQFLQQGWGRPVDAAAACTWFRKAAQQRVPYAEHLWADCLAQGIGRKADMAQAVSWYERAAEDGHWLSGCTAARHLLRGEGVPKDAARGLALCTRAAQSDSPPAMLQLAQLVDEGGAAPQDLPAARYWYEQAAQHRLREAQYRLGVMLAQGLGTQADLDRARYWLETAASAGYLPAYLPTAELYGNAPVQAGTGALAPEHLAKVYLWSAAARARQTDPRLREQASQIEAQALAVMPASWRTELDRKVAEHLARVASPP
jgi:uncharacterized protein